MASTHLGVFWDWDVGPLRLSRFDAPAQTVALTDTSGTANPIPGMTNNPQHASWLDSWWCHYSGTNKPWNGGANYRFQSQRGKHIGRVNVVWVDGHAAAMRPSQLKWGNFTGYLTSAPPTGEDCYDIWAGSPPAHRFNDPIALPDWDEREQP